MDQYHFQPLDPEEIRKMQRIAFGFVLFVTLTLVLAFAGCSEKEQPPTLEERLQGAWQREWIHLTNRYNFHGGACDAYAIIEGQPVQYYAYAYTTHGDTLTMLDLACGDGRRAVVSFPTDSTAVLGWIGGVDYFLKRI